MLPFLATPLQPKIEADFLIKLEWISFPFVNKNMPLFSIEKESCFKKIEFEIFKIVFRARSKRKVLLYLYDTVYQ